MELWIVLKQFLSTESENSFYPVIIYLIVYSKPKNSQNNDICNNCAVLYAKGYIYFPIMILIKWMF